MLKGRQRAGFDGCVCVWEVRVGASTAPHLMHHWQAHPGSEILTILHDPMKNVIITAGNDSSIGVSDRDVRHASLRELYLWWLQTRLEVDMYYSQACCSHC